MYAVVLGTRPEAIKLAPVIKELHDHKLLVKIILTGQHPKMASDILGEFHINATYGMDAIGNDLNEKIGNTLIQLSDLLRNCHTVIVQGDTYSALVGALAASNLGLKVAHVEAGLRTYNKNSPFPEENYRRMIAAVTDYHFAATPRAASNLHKEGYTSVFTTGNTVIDALRSIDAPTKQFERSTLLLTLHRRENWGLKMKAMLDAVGEISEELNVDVLFPVHPNPKFKPIIKSLKPSIKVVENLGYVEFISAMKGCYLVLTDSGGVQEEAPTFDKPVIVLRDTTERPEGIGQNAVLASTPEELKDSVKMLVQSHGLYEQYAMAPNPYGDGHAAERIVNQLETIRRRTKETSHSSHE